MKDLQRITAYMRYKFTMNLFHHWNNQLYRHNI